MANKAISRSSSPAIERKVIDIHAYIGYLVLREYEINKKVCHMTLFHHSLTPFTLDGQIIACTDENVKSLASMLKTVDVYDALTTDRPYRRHLVSGQAVDIIRKLDYYDEEVLEILCGLPL